MKDLLDDDSIESLNIKIKNNKSTEIKDRKWAKSEKEYNKKKLKKRNK